MQSGSGSPEFKPPESKPRKVRFVYAIVVVILLAIAAYSGYAYGQSSSNSSNPQLSILTASWITLVPSVGGGPSGTCTIQNSLVPPEAICGVTVDLGQQGELTLVISNHAGRGVGVAFSLDSSYPSHVFFITYSGCAHVTGFCPINPNSNGSFQFVYEATQGSYPAPIQANLTVEVASVSP